MENLELLRSLIKKYGNLATKPSMNDLQEKVLNEYCKREPLTNEGKKYISDLTSEMVHNFYGSD